jgi:hypothetical protein
MEELAVVLELQSGRAGTDAIATSRDDRVDRDDGQTELVLPTTNEENGTAPEVGRKHDDEAGALPDRALYVDGSS